MAQLEYLSNIKFSEADFVRAWLVYHPVELPFDIWASTPQIDDIEKYVLATDCIFKSAKRGVTKFWFSDLKDATYFKLRFM